MVSSMLQVERGYNSPIRSQISHDFPIFLSATGKLVVWGARWFGSPNESAIGDTLPETITYPLQKSALLEPVIFRTCRLGGDTLQGTNIFPKNGILKMIFLFPRWDMLIPWRVCGCSPGGYLGTTHLWGQGLPQTRRPAGLDGDYPGATGPGIHIREIGGVGGGKFIPFDLKWRKQNNWLNIFEDFYCWSIVFFCLKRQSSKWSRSYFNMDVQGVQHWIEWNVRHWLAFFTIQDSVWVRWKNLKSIGCIGVWCNVQRTRQNPNLITAHLFRDLWNRSNQQPASSRLDASHDAEQAHPCLHGIYYICTCIEWILKSWWCGKTTVFWSCKLPGLEFFIALMKMCGVLFSPVVAVHIYLGQELQLNLRNIVCKQATQPQVNCWFSKV